MINSLVNLKNKEIKKSDSKNQLAIIDDKYRLSFDIANTIIYVYIDSFLFKNKRFTKVFLENNPDKHIYFNESPREVVKILSAAYIEHKDDPDGFINFLRGKENGSLESSKKKQITQQ